MIATLDMPCPPVSRWHLRCPPELDSRLRRVLPCPLGSSRFRDSVTRLWPGSTPMPQVRTATP